MNPAGSILLVEDEAIIAWDLKSRLESAGYPVCRMIATGEDSVLWAERSRPGVILMDNRLAGQIDGLEAALRIRAISDVPIVFMTGYPQDEEFRRRIEPVHPLACLTKPVNIEELRKILKDVFGGSSALQPV
jgi:CheY-like chemotaxis protein